MQGAAMQPRLQRDNVQQLTAPKQAFLFHAHVVQLADADADGPQRFTMLANSGKPIRDHAWFGSLGINLQGVRWTGKVPVLLDHDTTKRIGVAEALSVTDNGLEATGKFLRNADAQAVLQDSKAGFPWQASVYLKASKVLEIAAGEEHVVNGHTMTGPGYVFEESELREVTFTALGADPNTSAAALSSDDAGMVTATLTSKNMPEQKTESPNIDEARLRQEATQAAQTAERTRVQRIMAAADATQLSLASSLVQSGATVEDAMAQLLSDMRTKLSALRSPSQDTQPLAAGNRSEHSTADAEAARLAAMPEGTEKWEAQWSKDAALRAEFSDKNVYLSYMRNRHRITNYGMRTGTV